MKKLIYLTLGILGTIATSTLAETSHRPPASSNHAMPYAGQEQREIKTLSAADIDDLRNGRGWGLAKAAEVAATVKRETSPGTRKRGMPIGWFY